MKTKDVSSVDEIGMLAIRFFTSWHPERWVGEGTPAYEASKHMRLEVARWKRANRKPRTKKR